MYNKSFPLNTKRIKKEKHKAGITKRLRNSITTKHKICISFLNKPTAFNETNYEGYKNKLMQLIKVAERYHYQKGFNKHKSDLMKMWQMIREITSKKASSQQNQVLLIIGTLTQDRQLIADKFNEYFTTVGSELTKDIPTVTKRIILMEFMKTQCF